MEFLETVRQTLTGLWKANPGAFSAAAYLTVMNLYLFILCGIDKAKARAGAWRIPEKRFFILSALGGSVGMLIGMYTFRHKTKHRTFTLGIPAILAAQLALLWVLEAKLGAVSAFLKIPG